MIFSIQDLSFTLGSLLLEGYAALAARLACAALLVLAGLALQKALRGGLFPRLQKLPLRPAALPILVKSFAGPVDRFALATGIYLALASLPWGIAAIQELLLTLYRLVLILLLTWGLYGASDLTGLLLSSTRKEIKGSRTLQNVLEKAYKALVGAMGILMAAQELGLPVTGVITGAGLAGLTISLAAQDTASNLFGGLMILIERPFEVGDWIIVGDVEGAVEDISFRSTRVRALDNSIYVLTNSNVCSSTINNCTQRQKRLYRFTLSVAREVTRPQLEKLMADLRAMLAASPHTYEDSVIVQLSGFGASSIDILVSAYLRTPDYSTFLQMQSELHLDLIDVMQAAGVAFSFPTTNVYIKDAPRAN